MLKRQLSRSASICDGFRQLHFIHLGRGFLPLLAVILLAAPSLAFANGLIVTVNPKSLVIEEPPSGSAIGTYSVKLDSAPSDLSDEVTITVVGGSDSVTVDNRELPFMAVAEVD